MIQAVSRQVPDLNMQFSRPGNGAAQAILTVGRVMKVVMVFSGSYVDHVFAKGLDESLGEPVILHYINSKLHHGLYTI